MTPNYPEVLSDEHNTDHRELRHTVPRSTWDGRTSVYSYGTPAKAADSVPEEAIAQLRLAHELRNALVEIDRAHGEVKQAVWDTHPTFAEAKAAHSAADEVVRALTAQAVDERKADRTTKPRNETKAALREARQVRTGAKTHLRTARDLVYPQIKEAMTTARAERALAVKATYATFVQSRGLYWATYNLVVAHHEVSVKQIRSQRSEGRLAELHFHHYTGEGTLAVQLQRDRNDPQRTPAILAGAESTWRNTVRIPSLPEDFETLSRGDQRRAGRGVVAVRIGVTPDHQPLWWEIPIQMHRPIPADADIIGVEVTRRRVAGHYRLQVAFTCRLPAVVQRSEGAVVGMDIGWRSTSDGSLRVAVFEVMGGHQRPPEHEGIRSLGAGHYEVVVPSSWRGVWENIEKRQSIRARDFNAAKEGVVTFLRAHPAMSESLGVEPANVARWQAAGRLAGLVHTWRTLRADKVSSGLRADTETAAYAAVEAWRRQDRHLWEWERNEAEQIARRRRDLYRMVAAWLADIAGVVRVEEFNLASVSQRPKPGEEDTEQARAARHNARVAAPGELRSCIEMTCKREGVSVERREATGTTLTCFRCGTSVREPGAAARSIMLWCATCESTFDQDLNAARWLASGWVPEQPG